MGSTDTHLRPPQNSVAFPGQLCLQPLAPTLTHAAGGDQSSGAGCDGWCFQFVWFMHRHHPVALLGACSAITSK